MLKNQERFRRAGKRKIILRPDASELIMEGCDIVIEDYFVNGIESPMWYCLVYLTNEEDIKKLLSLGDRHFQDHGTNGSGFRVLYSSGNRDNVLNDIRKSLSQ